jgi:hypothetical protein
MYRLPDNYIAVKTDRVSLRCPFDMPSISFDRFFFDRMTNTEEIVGLLGGRGQGAPCPPHPSEEKKYYFIL